MRWYTRSSRHTLLPGLVFLLLTIAMPSQAAVLSEVFIGGGAADRAFPNAVEVVGLQAAPVTAGTAPTLFSLQRRGSGFTVRLALTLPTDRNVLLLSDAAGDFTYATDGVPPGARHQTLAGRGLTATEAGRAFDFGGGRTLALVDWSGPLPLINSSVTASDLSPRLRDAVTLSGSATTAALSGEPVLTVAPGQVAAVLRVSGTGDEVWRVATPTATGVLSFDSGRASVSPGLPNPSLVAVAVPEPGTAVMPAAGLALTFLRRRGAGRCGRGRCGL